MTNQCRKNLTYFFVMFLILFSFSCICNVTNKDLLYDAAIYWNLGKSYIANDSFSFANISGAWRGYLLPLIYCITNIIGSNVFHEDMMGYRVVSSIIFAAAFVYLVPLITEFIFGKTRNKIFCFFPLALFLIFWYNAFIYPLSDMIAIIFNFLMLAIVNSIIKVFNTQDTNNKRTYFRLSYYAFLFGIIMYCTYNIRTIYQFSGILAFIVLICLFYKKTKNLKYTLIIMLSVLLGVFVASIPQIIINFKYIHKFSMRVPIDSLLSQQLYWGVFTQRYETNIGTNYQLPGMNFYDPVGLAILNKEGIKGFSNILDLFGLICKYPLDFVGIYTRHFINALLPVFPEGYIKNIYRIKMPLILLNYILLYLSGFSAYTRHLLKKKNMELASETVIKTQSSRKRRNNTKTINSDNQTLKYNKIFAFIIILIPCIAILPGSIEVRFFLPLYLMMYSYLAFISPWKEMKSCFFEHKIGCITSFILALAVCCSVWGNTFANLQYEKLFLQ